MSELQLVTHGAPTLAGIKIGNLIRVSIENRDDSYRLLEDINRRISPYGVQAIPLLERDGYMWVYIFRPAMLSNLFRNTDVVDFLTERGYEASSVYTLIISLREKMSSMSRGGSFPHEIGVFLGYPLDDVKAFCLHQGSDYLFCDVWKVYHDVCSAKRICARFRKCTDIYTKMFTSGTSIERLTVRDRFTKNFGGTR